VLVALLVLGNYGIVNAGRTWINTQIQLNDGSTISGGNSELAMRSGSTWPVIATPDVIISMTPVGWSPVSYPGSNTKLSSATSSDGTIGFSFGHGSVVTMDTSGISISSYGGSGRNSIAFDNNNNVAVLHSPANLTLARSYGGGWIQDDLGFVANGPFALEIDSYNQANVAYAESDGNNGSNLTYALKGTMTQNQWINDEIATGLVSVTAVEIAMMAGDSPVVAYADTNGLGCATYNILTDSWNTSNIAPLRTSNGGFSVASDSQGGVGIAYSSPDGLKYMHNNGSGWDIDNVIIDAVSTDFGDVGLAFDAQDIPVISYTNSGGNLWLAYDPPSMVPEPASLALLLIGGFAIARKRKN